MFDSIVDDDGFGRYIYICPLYAINPLLFKAAFPPLPHFVRRRGYINAVDLISPFTRPGRTHYLARFLCAERLGGVDLGFEGGVLGSDGGEILVGDVDFEDGEVLGIDFWVCAEMRAELPVGEESGEHVFDGV